MLPSAVRGNEPDAHADHATAAHGEAAAHGDGNPTLTVKCQPAAPAQVEASVSRSSGSQSGMPADAIERVRQRLAERLHAKPVSPQAVYDVKVTGRQAAATRPRRPAAMPVDVEPAAEPAHWAYEGPNGPAAWSTLRPEFSLCGRGTRQSPIDIRDELRVQLEPVRFDYRASGFSVVDNGHTVMVNVDQGNAIEVMGRRYELQQFHFHRPSEERLNGRLYDMNVHLVHVDAEGRQAVVAVLLERGSVQPVVQTVWNNLPLEKHETQRALQMLDPAGLLPAERQYYTYMGSMTTPPCYEGVLWMVMRQPVALSDAQLKIFSRLYPMNARPLQSAAGRVIKGSE